MASISLPSHHLCAPPPRRTRTNPVLLTPISPLNWSSSFGTATFRFEKRTGELRPTRSVGVRCEASQDGTGRVTQQEFTEMAWQAIVSSPEVAKESNHQIVETEHLMKALLEQKNGLARRIFTKAGVDNSRLLDSAVKFIERQPRVKKQALHLINSSLFLQDIV